MALGERPKVSFSISQGTMGIAMVTKFCYSILLSRHLSETAGDSIIWKANRKSKADEPIN